MSRAHVDPGEPVVFRSSSGRQLVTERHLVFLRRQRWSSGPTKFPLEQIRRLATRPAFDWPRAAVLVGLSLVQFVAAVLVQHTLMAVLAATMVVSSALYCRIILFRVEDLGGETTIKMYGRLRDVRALAAAAEGQANLLRSRRREPTFRPALA